eukprot:TRINITY_DN37091_c0_g1_i1.p1 TRINITY_DN37091_c0_g1~~TRINITY_DN37091_c0_g1_i1.p1  ORF type:complete len:161 (-),score=37.55 TRINITY_DN37091_c0_g1_i1:154-579(-)
MSEYPAQTYQPYNGAAYNGQAYPPPYAPTPNPEVNVVVSAPPVYATNPNTPLITADVHHHHHHGQKWGETPQRHYCQFCGNHVVTEVRYETGTLTWIAAGGLVLLGCIFGCCLIPFCVDSMKDPVHVCPACHNVVGRKNRV